MDASPYMAVNLFDVLFAHTDCSVAWQQSKHIGYIRDQMVYDGVTLFTDGHVNSPLVDRVRSRYKIGWLREPRCLHPETYAAIDPGRFDLLLTYDEELLQDSRCAFVPYGGVWIPMGEWGVRGKSKKVSMLYGSKRSAAGHLLRHEVAESTSGVDYFGYSGTPVDYSPATKLLVHGDYMFSIVIETCNEPNLFTEILLDCMVVGTVPLLWGCPNVGEFFDERGLLSFNSVPELHTLLDGLSPQLYQSMLPYVTENVARVKEYAVTEDWMYKHILYKYAEAPCVSLQHSA